MNLFPLSFFFIFQFNMCMQQLYIFIYPNSRDNRTIIIENLHSYICTNYQELLDDFKSMLQTMDSFGKYEEIWAGRDNI